MSQNECVDLSKTQIEYHTNQFEIPYRGTIAFCDWLESRGLFSSKNKLNVADIGAGAGSNVYFMSKRYPNINFTGIELNKELVHLGNKIIKTTNQQNCNLKYGDLYNLNKKIENKYNGIVSFQTLSWLPEYKIPIKKISSLNPDWIAMTSLFNEEEVDLKIQIKDYSRLGKKKPFKEGYYNIYPLKHVKDHFKKLGYPNFAYSKFEIDIDLPKPKSKGLATYTEKLENGSRIQISGGILMNWYSIMATK